MRALRHVYVLGCSGIDADVRDWGVGGLIQTRVIVRNRRLFITRMLNIATMLNIAPMLDIVPTSNIGKM